MKLLDQVQLKKVSDQLEKYGIESPDLRAELTDHYAGEIEEQMESGKSFEEAFNRFGAANSWTKLRKLEHQQAELQLKGLRNFLRFSLRDTLIGRKAWISYPIIALLYFIVDLSEGSGEPLLFIIQGVAASVAVGVIIFMLKQGKSNLNLCGPLLSLAMFQLYLSLYLPVTNLVPWSHPVFDGFYLAREVNTVYYALWIWGIYVTIKYYHYVRRKTKLLASVK